MFDKLDQSRPLGGPAWVNWRNLITTILGTIAIAILTVSWAKMTIVYAQYSGLPMAVMENTKQIQELSPKLDEILGILKQFETERETVTGKVLVVSDGSGHRSQDYIWLNELSPAIIHKASKKVLVTNLNDPSRRATPMTVRGTISSPQYGVVAEISKEGAQALHAEGDTNTLTVRISPYAVPAGK